MMSKLLDNALAAAKEFGAGFIVSVILIALIAMLVGCVL